MFTCRNPAKGFWTKETDSSTKCFLEDLAERLKGFNESSCLFQEFSLPKFTHEHRIGDLLALTHHCLHTRKLPSFVSSLADLCKYLEFAFTSCEPRFKFFLICKYQNLLACVVHQMLSSGQFRYHALQILDTILFTFFGENSDKIYVNMSHSTEELVFKPETQVFLHNWFTRNYLKDHLEYLEQVLVSQDENTRTAYELTTLILKYL